MSTGHAIVLLTTTRLVATVEEKTLVVMDEPESHLHPPLIAAFLRAVSNLIVDRNGVVIIATHSPVVLQEVPKTCVWKSTGKDVAFLLVDQLLKPLAKASGLSLARYLDVSGEIRLS